MQLNRKHVVVAGLVAALALAGCSKTFQRRGGVEKSGFLGDYSQLQEGQKGRATLGRMMFVLRLPARDAERLLRFARRDLRKAATNAAMLNRIELALDAAPGHPGRSAPGKRRLRRRRSVQKL